MSEPSQAFFFHHQYLSHYHTGTMISSSGYLRYKGCSQFRQRIVASTLSGHPLRIDEIRSGKEDELQPGIQDFEASFLRLVEKMCDGCRIEINETGTALKFKPGIITGGRIKHDCGQADAQNPNLQCRSIGWFVEGIIPLAVFAKDPVHLQLSGITNDALDLSVDVLTNVTLPLLRNFGVEGATLKLKKRGAAPKGGGYVEISIPLVREVSPINITETGLVKRVRGVVYCSRITPTILTRVVDSAREVLNNLLPDVHIHTDHYKGSDGGGFSPGYSLALVAETTKGALLCAERTAMTAEGKNETPEDVGREGALLLLEEVRRGGVIDSCHQCLVLQLMVMGPEDVTKVRFGPLSPAAIKLLRLLRAAFGVVFKIKDDDADGTTVLSCLGIGYKNISRRVT